MRVRPDMHAYQRHAARAVAGPGQVGLLPAIARAPHPDRQRAWGHAQSGVHGVDQRVPPLLVSPACASCLPPAACAAEAVLRTKAVRYIPYSRVLEHKIPFGPPAERTLFIYFFINFTSRFKKYEQNQTIKILAPECQGTGHLDELVSYYYYLVASMYTITR